MTPLEAELRVLIATDGPIPVDRYMALALGHPRHGYYMTRDPLGVGGDFVTAPEISQVFGELIGIWAASIWQRMGSPSPVRLVELGPGRGTLMADILRSAQSMAGFRAALDVHLVETSPLLAALQKERLGAAHVTWHRGLDTVPGGATILVANEFLDALPVRQFVMIGTGWRERVIGIHEDRLAFGLAPDPVPPALIPEPLRDAAEGAVAEICPAFDSLARELGECAARHPLAALFVDYGHAETQMGETLQAVKAHRFVPVLDDPGEADITAHVDFAALARAAEAHGLAATPVITQRDLLFRLGLQARAEALAKANPDAFPALKHAVERLIDPGPTGMGQMFKAITLASGSPSRPAEAS
ncbi:class I SAM-dependent methyltransferase [Phreatobacter aquaticus]|uniref:Class I SAM-dependent methyltransferase n=1 Tax=Phreatobacter aquaticus TaxID=2570229 RepID=A0A4D7QF47_9HYPH|nr:SAM-dependent methyltransferase [Phreatobacter aquaticus]QCK84313.1 class I SAM-dependent methyltransferase [Phreatobacter aquaticus]